MDVFVYNDCIGIIIEFVEMFNDFYWNLVEGDVGVIF